MILMGFTHIVQTYQCHGQHLYLPVGSIQMRHVCQAV